MRRCATIRAVCTMCQNSLGAKSFEDYTSYDIELLIQRGVLKGCWQEYDEFMSHQTEVLSWVADFDRRGRDNKIVADTWRWCLGINKKLPVKIQKQH